MTESELAKLNAELMFAINPQPELHESNAQASNKAVLDEKPKLKEQNKLMQTPASTKSGSKRIAQRFSTLSLKDGIIRKAESRQQSLRKKKRESIL